ncbi:tail fiber protein [Synechococcus phage S-N03]|uniref:Tail fiber protein n=1 Tax=Synechococcus phage S-N03 TaxID=2718943 RepID=A0A6G8R5I2_9CAUD|nr:tail fiber protein [Synechococcus phage S-N03]QIN96644.1 tail fiber protein [Synechococcus phage S-N03]
MPVRIDGTGSVSGLTNYTAENFTTTNLTATDATVTGDITNPSFDALELAPRNLIINGAMAVDQRNNGGVYNPNSVYSFSIDRYATWYSIAGGTGTTIQQVQDAPSGFQYSYKLTVGTGATPTGSDYGRLAYTVEGYDAKVLEIGTTNQKAFNLSFYVKVSVAGTYGVQIHSQDAVTKYQSSFTIASGDVNSWVRRDFTVPASTIDTGTFGTTNDAGFSISFDLGEGPDRSIAAGYYPSTVSTGAVGLTGGTKIMATSGATYQLTGLQLTATDTPIAFQHEDYGTTLRKCQRYYEVAGVLHMTTGWASIANTVTWATTKRDVPSVSTDGTDAVWSPNFVGGTQSARVSGAFQSAGASSASGGYIVADAEL